MNESSYKKLSLAFDLIDSHSKLIIKCDQLLNFLKEWNLD